MIPSTTSYNKYDQACGNMWKHGWCPWARKCRGRAYRDARTVRQLTGEVAALGNDARTVGWPTGEMAGTQSVQTTTRHCNGREESGGNSTEYMGTSPVTSGRNFTEHTGASVGCIYAPYKVNPNISQFYFDFPDIFHHTSMHPLFRNIYEFYPIFYDFISPSIIYLNHLYLRQHFLFDSIWHWIC